MSVKSKLQVLLSLRKRFLYLANKGAFRNMDDEKYLSKLYYARLGKKLDLVNPKTFNEKLQWLKLYDRKPIYTTMVDKYAVKQYVAERIGKECIIPTLGVWDKFDDIDFTKLPNQFVLKCTHDSGGVAICRDKNSFDKQTAKMKIERSLKKNYYWHGREWPYKDVKPRIIAEQYMEDKNTKELRDYKFYCFHGVPKMIMVNSGRGAGETTADYYDMERNYLDFTWGYPHSNHTQSMPENFELMKQLATVLSENIPHIRVDFYEVNGSVYFGELTFFDGSGFDIIAPEDWDIQIGSWVNIHEIAR